MEAEKIKTDLLRMLKDFMYGAPTNLEIFADKVINLFESKFKQPPVSVMPGEEKLKEIIAHCWSIGRTGTDDSLKEAIDVILPRLLSLSKEAPKEQDKENEFTAFDQIRSETPKGIDDMVDKAMKEADERETAIDEIIGIICSSSGGGWNKKDRYLANEVDVYEAATRIFDLFKQRNK